jgi:hypothetical protein
MYEYISVSYEFVYVSSFVMTSGHIQLTVKSHQRHLPLGLRENGFIYPERNRKDM